MKKLDRIILNLFSFIILIIAITTALLIFHWINYEFVELSIETALKGEVTSKVILGVDIVVILLAIKCLFFEPEDEDDAEEIKGIQLQNSSGRLLISRDTIENIVGTVTQSFDAVKNVQTEVGEDKENQLIVTIEMTVGGNAIIKELSTNVQTKVKEAIKNTLDLEVKEVNIKIINIEKMQ